MTQATITNANGSYNLKPVSTPMMKTQPSALNAEPNMNTPPTETSLLPLPCPACQSTPVQSIHPSKCSCNNSKCFLYKFSVYLSDWNTRTPDAATVSEVEVKRIVEKYAQQEYTFQDRALTIEQAICETLTLKGADAATKEWQSMDSAPKDGTIVLGYIGYNILMKFRNGNWLSYTTNFCIHPTHWMYLPAPPIDNASKQDGK